MTILEDDAAPIRVPPERPSFARTLRLLTTCLQNETEALQQGTPYDIRATAIQKNRYLLDLTRAARQVAQDGPNEEQHRELAQFRTTLQHNAAALGAHVSAIREISGFFQEIIEESNSDGTYSRPGY